MCALICPYPCSTCDVKSNRLILELYSSLSSEHLMKQQASKLSRKNPVGLRKKKKKVSILDFRSRCKVQIGFFFFPPFLGISLSSNLVWHLLPYWWKFSSTEYNGFITDIHEDKHEEYLQTPVRVTQRVLAFCVALPYWLNPVLAEPYHSHCGQLYYPPLPPEREGRRCKGRNSRRVVHLLWDPLLYQSLCYISICG